MPASCKGGRVVRYGTFKHDGYKHAVRAVNAEQRISSRTRGTTVGALMTAGVNEEGRSLQHIGAQPARHTGARRRRLAPSEVGSN
jgi:hypothetical protein